MNKIFFSVTALIVHLFAFTFAAKLPSDWIRCHIRRSDSSSCLARAVQDAIIKLEKGAPELSITTFEPLHIPAMTIGEGTGPVNVVQNFKNVKIHGVTSSKVIKSEHHIDENILIAQSITPMIRLEADYQMSGRVLLLPIVGEGECNVTLINTKINHTLYTETFEKKGKKFLRVKDYVITLRPERVTFKFDHLFNGDDRLGNELNKVLNDNWDAVFTDVRGGYEESLGLIFKDLANRIFTKVPLKDIYYYD